MQKKCESGFSGPYLPLPGLFVGLCPRDQTPGMKWKPQECKHKMRYMCIYIYIYTGVCMYALDAFRYRVYIYIYKISYMHKCTLSGVYTCHMYDHQFGC